MNFKPKTLKLDRKRLWRNKRTNPTHLLKFYKEELLWKSLVSAQFGSMVKVVSQELNQRLGQKLGYSANTALAL
jgi:hypothetical protein